jgi:uncharacterized protein
VLANKRAHEPVIEPHMLRPRGAAVVGIGLRAGHYSDLLAAMDAGPVGIDFVEVHSENFFGLGGQPLAYLDQFAARLPISLHGVGLSLASADPLSATHLRRLQQLVTRVQPRWVSDHLAWVGSNGRYFNDLLPAALTPAALTHVCARVDAVQDALGRQFLVENITQYVPYDEAAIPEAVFLQYLCERTRCGLVLDLNNLYVNQRNLGKRVTDYLDALDPRHVHELHLGGFEWQGAMAIDTHGAPVPDAVWQLLAAATPRFAHAAVLIERDNNLPPLLELLGEAGHAREILCSHLSNVGADAVLIRSGAVQKQAPQFPAQWSAWSSAPALVQGGTVQADFASYERALASALVDPSVRVPDVLVSGLAIYRSSVSQTQQSALAAIYPAVHGVLGAARFSAIARATLDAHPSSSGDLNTIGAQLWQSVSAPEVIQEWPFLPDLARLEWLVHQVFHAADANAISLAVLAGALVEAGDGAESCQVEYVPAFALMPSPFSLLPYWAKFAGEDTHSITTATPGMVGVMVVRNDASGVMVEALTAGELCFCEALQRCDAIGAALKLGLRTDPTFNLQSMLMRLANTGAIAAVLARKAKSEIPALSI